MGQLADVAEGADLAREHAAAPGHELLLVVVDRPAEEDQLEAAAAVGQGDLQALAPAVVELVHPGVGDLGDDGDVLVQRQVGEAGQLAALGVAARVVVQQIADRVQVEVLGQHLRGVAAERLLQRFLERGHGSIAHHAADNRAYSMPISSGADCCPPR